jgi:3-hydroxymyristoyl/3-hydroxydecanoyl-(acyl carrier protein) dehydratase
MPLEFRLLARTEQHGRFAVEIPPDLLWLQGHFPGAPLLPGIAQLLALVLDRTHALWPELGQPRRVSRLKFKHPIRPGDQLEVRLERNADEVRFGLHRGDETCTSGALVFT